MSGLLPVLEQEAVPLVRRESFTPHVQGVLANRDDFCCDLKLKTTQNVASWTKKAFTMLKQPSYDSLVLRFRHNAQVARDVL